MAVERTLMPKMFMRLKGKRLPSGRLDDDPLNGDRKLLNRLLELPW